MTPSKRTLSTLLLVALVCVVGCWANDSPGEQLVVPETSALDARQRSRIALHADSSPAARQNHAPQQRRNLVDFWNLLFMLGPHPCPPVGKPHDDCVAAHASHGGGGGGGGSSSSSSSSSSSGGGSSSSSSSGSGGGSDSSSDGDGSSHSTSSQENSGSLRSGRAKTFSALMLVAAAVAAALAIAAVILGSRKTAKEMHPLQGSVGRRMGLFSNFADANLCSNNSNRPQRVVEMTMSDDSQYKGMV